MTYAKTKIIKTFFLAFVFGFAFIFASKVVPVIAQNTTGPDKDDTFSEGTTTPGFSAQYGEITVQDDSSSAPVAISDLPVISRQGHRGADSTEPD